MMTEPQEFGASLPPGDDAPMTPLALGKGVAAWRQIADAIEAGIAAGTPAAGEQIGRAHV